MESATALRLLIVDDCRDAADSLGLLTGLWGHEAFVAYSSQSALELAATARPHVALLDLALPSMSGFDLAHRLRERPELDSLILIAVTGLSDQATHYRAMRSGFEHVLVKPTDPEALKRLLAQIVAETLIRTPPPPKKTKKMPVLRPDAAKAPSHRTRKKP
jgi:CheY-like chemotaxis protein